MSECLSVFPFLKVAFSRKVLWKYALFQFFIIFSSRYFDGAFDWLRGEIWIQIQPIRAPSKNLKEKLMKNQRSVYFHEPFREKVTFTKSWLFCIVLFCKKKKRYWYWVSHQKFFQMWIFYLRYFMRGTIEIWTLMSLLPSLYSTLEQTLNKYLHVKVFNVHNH